jgi:NAD-dependent deacetylase
MEIPHPDGLVIVLSGAGLSAASGVPTFRDGDGLWEGHHVEEVATPRAWTANQNLVREFYDQRRINCSEVIPNPGHIALARLQQELGTERVKLVTQNIDGLLSKAGAPQVCEMHGSLWRLKCDRNGKHPKLHITGVQEPEAPCNRCSGHMRPDVVWFGEMPYNMEEIYSWIRRCSLFLSVGTSGMVYPAAGFTAEARAAGAWCVEINPRPAGGPFNQVIAEGSETALPRIVEQWLNE